MRVYQLKYRTHRSELSTLETWPLARELFNLPDNQVFSTPELEGFVRAYNDVRYPETTEWFGSEREAVVRRLELYKSGKLVGKKLDHEIWPVDIPTDKQGLLGWLKENCI